MKSAIHKDFSIQLTREDRCMSKEATRRELQHLQKERRYILNKLKVI
ncbi:MAG: hypothetical protein ACMUEM_02140 [Flavobacteriales bacterium AspAUS03]